VSGRRLLIVTETQDERDSVIRFLGEHGCQALPGRETRAVIEDCDRGEPGLSTLVALVEDWRCAARVGEVALELGERRTILRTEA
jgi:hypothetical protein